MTDDELQQIRARAEAADNRGKWLHRTLDSDETLSRQGCEVVLIDTYAAIGIAQMLEKADAKFIAHARADIPALLAEVERLRNIERKAIEQSETVQRDWLSPMEATELKAEVERLRTENAELEAANKRMWRIHEWQDAAGIIGGKRK